MRRPLAIAGDRAQFVLADDGTTWWWSGERWVEVPRPPLPQPEPEPVPTPKKGGKK